MSHLLSHGEDAPFHPQLDDFPPHFHPHLQGAALDAQSASIGWENAVKGLFSSQWRHVATLDMHHVSRVDNSQGNVCMRSIIHDATREFTYNTWLSRNSDLTQNNDSGFDRRCHLNVRHNSSQTVMQCHLEVQCKQTRKEGAVITRHTINHNLQVRKT